MWNRAKRSALECPFTVSPASEDVTRRIGYSSWLFGFGMVIFKTPFDMGI